MLIKCPECGKQVSDRAANCPECGCPMRGKAPINPSHSGCFMTTINYGCATVIGLIIVNVIFFFIYAGTPDFPPLIIILLPVVAVVYFARKKIF